MGPPRRAVPGALRAPHHEPAPWGAPIAGASPGDFAAAPPDPGLAPEGGSRGARPPAFGGPPRLASCSHAPTGLRPLQGASDRPGGAFEHLLPWSPAASRSTGFGEQLA